MKKTRILYAMSAALIFGASAVLAAEAKVTITSPENGAMVGQKVTLNFQAEPGAEGNHLHLYVDGKRVDVIHELKGSTETMVSPGGHKICMEVETKAHMAVSPQTCINVTAK